MSMVVLPFVMYTITVASLLTLLLHIVEANNVPYQCTSTLKSFNEDIPIASIRLDHNIFLATVRNQEHEGGGSCVGHVTSPRKTDIFYVRRQVRRRLRTQPTAVNYSRRTWWPSVVTKLSSIFVPSSTPPLMSISISSKGFILSVNAHPVSSRCKWAENKRRSMERLLAYIYMVDCPLVILWAGGEHLSPMDR